MAFAERMGFHVTFVPARARCVENYKKLDMCEWRKGENKNWEVENLDFYK